jgi:hypothetical protein
MVKGRIIQTTKQMVSIGLCSTVAEFSDYGVYSMEMESCNFTVERLAGTALTK